MRKEELTNTVKGIEEKRRKDKMNSQIYEDYKQYLINIIIEKGKRDLNKKTVSQLDSILKGIGDKIKC